MDQLLKIIVCPKCHGTLSLNKKDHELICKFDALAFPIREGIPVLLESESRKISN